jgi:prepilin peptidase CpaA
MTIPNWVSIAAALLFPPVAFAAGIEPSQIGLHLLVGVGAFALGFGLFSFGVLGGGDVKVIAAATVWTGVAALSSFAFAMTLAGGVLAAVLLLARKAAKPAEGRPAFLARLLDPARGIPYAVAIAVGVVFSLPAQPVTLALLAR